MSNEELYRRLWDIYGEENQLCKLMEECGELIQATNKVRMKRREDYVISFVKELADVKIMIEQMELLLVGILPLKQEKEKKLDRLRKMVL